MNLGSHQSSTIPLQQLSVWRKWVESPKKCFRRNCWASSPTIQTNAILEEQMLEVPMLEDNNLNGVSSFAGHPEEECTFISIYNTEDDAALYNSRDVTYNPLVESYCLSERGTLRSFLQSNDNSSNLSTELNENCIISK